MLVEDDGHEPLRLAHDRGETWVRHYRAPGGATRAMLWAGGAGGGFDSPANDLYARLSRDLAREGVSSLRVRFRDPADLNEATYDALVGIAYLQSQGVERVGLCGHSFGGAVVIRAAVLSEVVATVVTLATQAHGADVAARLAPRCPLLLLHGTADKVLPDGCSTFVHGVAGEPKRLVLLPGAGHVLDEAADQVEKEVRAWIAEHLR